MVHCCCTITHKGKAWNTFWWAYHYDITLKVLTREEGSWDGGKYTYQVTFDVKGV